MTECPRIEWLLSLNELLLGEEDSERSDESIPESPTIECDLLSSCALKGLNLNDYGLNSEPKCLVLGCLRLPKAYFVASLGFRPLFDY